MYKPQTRDRREDIGGRMRKCAPVPLVEVAAAAAAGKGRRSQRRHGYVSMHARERARGPRFSILAPVYGDGVDGGVYVCSQRCGAACGKDARRSRERRV